MRIRFLSLVSVISVLIGANTAAESRLAQKSARHGTPAADHRYQGRNRGSEQTERLSRKIKLARDGSVSVSNVSGDIIVTGGSGDTVSIEAVKRARSDRGQLADVSVEINEAPSRVDVRTNYSGRNTQVSVDYTITVPAWASVDLNSVSGDMKITGVQGSVHVEAVSGDITASGTPRLEKAKSVSGDVTLTDAGGEGDISVGSISGSLHVKGLKSRGVEVSSVSGDVTLTNIACERLGAKSMSGNLEYDGTLARSGRYNLNSHSGNVRLILSNPSGFELDANTFSGSIHYDLPLTIGGDAQQTRNDRGHGMSNRRIHATFGDSSAVITVRTFSGDITIQKR